MNGFDVVELVCQEISHQCGLSVTSPACAFGSGRLSSACPYRMKYLRAADAVFRLQLSVEIGTYYTIYLTFDTNFFAKFFITD
jgi:hypothetical protein